ncbi:uncharacterized protein [Cicer arietinum]|uniref:Uncharacterized protein LOC101499148 n=1 Tax=Cicer arietinum TaxID=3827 RepID=A0A1S2XV42_CICAR|nr:uncharacterized protein LOC101499148 [Cicer arietinum]
MGNTSSFSCIPNCASVDICNTNGVKGIKKNTATLFDTNGNIREINLPVKSAELMIELIGHVITPADEIRRTRRITPLGADKELLAGKVYLLAPVSRVNSKASEFEILIAEKGSGKGRRDKTAKVSPSPKLTATEDSVNVVCQIPRVRNQRRWNPVLEPIFESP